MPEWIQENILPIVISTVIPAVIGLATVWLQLKSNKPVQSANVSQTTQAVYSGIIDELQDQIDRLKQARVDDRAEHEAEIADLRQEFSERDLKHQQKIADQALQLEACVKHRVELDELKQEVKDLKKEVKFAHDANTKLMEDYEREIKTRDEAIKALQDEVARLRNKMGESHA